VIQNNFAHMVSIKPGVTDGGLTQVEPIPGAEVINPGDVVANSSFDKLQDKIKVAISNKPAAPANAASASTSGSIAP
jgi:multidrug efflux system membrane fusion protein